jgi:hypothetical protein
MLCIFLAIFVLLNYDRERAEMCSRIKVGMWEALNPQPPIDYFASIYCVGNFFRRDRPPIPYIYYFYMMTPVNNTRLEEDRAKAGF